MVGSDPDHQLGRCPPVGGPGAFGVEAVGAGVGPASADEPGSQRRPAVVAGDGDRGAEGGEPGVVAFRFVDVGPFEF